MGTGTDVPAASLSARRRRDYICGLVAPRRHLDGVPFDRHIGARELLQVRPELGVARERSRHLVSASAATTTREGQTFLRADRSC